MSVVATSRRPSSARSNSPASTWTVVRVEAARETIDSWRRNSSR